METKYAPPEKDDQEKILIDFKRIESSGYMKEILNSLPYIAAILNSKRQIVFSNNALIKMLNVNTLENILGIRPGEAINCVNYAKEEGGCGTTEKCKYCGAVNAILRCQLSQKQETDELRVTTGIDGEEVNYDFLVSAAPLSFGNEEFMILTLNDISSDKRRKVLERTFFHDILNTAGSLNGILEIMKDVHGKDKFNEFMDLSRNTCRDLIDEILAQRDVLAAEQKELKVKNKPIFSTDLIREVIKQIMYNRVAKDKNIIIDKDASRIIFSTDDSLLKRVLVNMLKNALEATPSKGRVVIGCNDKENLIVFWVHNKDYIPIDIQNQIFKRSFSTKGMNRGIGTYSMKLIGERYLKGKVYFESDQIKGTTFYIELNI